MTYLELMEKANKAQEKLDKMYALIEKREHQIAKNYSKLNSLGFASVEEAEKERGRMDVLNIVWAISDAEYENKNMITHKIPEQRKIVNNWQERCARQREIESTLVHEVPQAMQDARIALRDSWVLYDIEYRNRMLDARKSMDYKEYRKLYKYSTEMMYNHTDEEFLAIEERQSTAWVLDIYNRVYNITGKVTDCDNLYYGGKCLNGTIVGENGSVMVETIVAGGYNIQRLHNRVIVHKLK